MILLVVCQPASGRGPVLAADGLAVEGGHCGRCGGRLAPVRRRHRGRQEVVVGAAHVGRRVELAGVVVVVVELVLVVLMERVLVERVLVAEV